MRPMPSAGATLTRAFDSGSFALDVPSSLLFDWRSGGSEPGVLDSLLGLYSETSSSSSQMPNQPLSTECIFPSTADPGSIRSVTRPAPREW